MKKQKIITSLSVLPDDVLLEIFTYMPVKQILLNISTLSKDIHNILSSKDFLVQLLNLNGFFSPVLKIETSQKFYKSFSSFYRFIYHPMEMSKTSTLKLKEKFPKKFFKLESFNTEKLILKLNEKLKQKIEIPPANQMFFLLCEEWGEFHKKFFIDGSVMLFRKTFLSNSCNCTSIEKENQIPIQYIQIGKIINTEIECSFFLCLDANENFGKIMATSNGELYLGFSKKTFHEMIQEIILFTTETYSDTLDFNAGRDLHFLIEALEFEYANDPKEIGEDDFDENSEDSEYEEEFELESDKSDEEEE
jgi:hypothetical protein